MSVLNITRAYSDGEVLTEAQLDFIISDLETYFNVTKIEGSNIQNSGLTGSTKISDTSVSSSKILNESVLTSKIVDSNITTIKINDLSVTNDKLADTAVTPAKLATLFLPAEPGSIRLFHTFNGVLSIPRGWMICNGDRVAETNYNATHGAGAWDTDEISLGTLAGVDSSNGAYLPDFRSKFSVGAATTTQPGTSAITTVGNTDNEVDINHSHVATGTSHGHTPLNSVFAQKFNRFASVTTPYLNAALGIKLTDETTFTLSSTGSLIKTAEPENISFLYIMRVI